jgi:ribose-phosphate pyrophosphokinase
VDDIIDTAGTLCKAAKKLHESGANHVVAACTHALLSGDAVSHIRESYLSEVVVTDTLQIPKRKKIDKITVLSASELLAEAVKRIHREQSISSLFYKQRE